jgi:hypothetical protein
MLQKQQLGTFTEYPRFKSSQTSTRKNSCTSLYPELIDSIQ